MWHANVDVPRGRWASGMLGGRPGRADRWACAGGKTDGRLAGQAVVGLVVLGKVGTRHGTHRQAGG